MKLIIFGRDQELSKLEFYTYTKSQNNDFKIIVDNERFWLVDFNNEDEIDYTNICNHLGGTLRIVDVKQELSNIYDLDLNSWDLFLQKKYSYAISTINLNEDELETIENHAKALAKQSKSKALYKRPNTRSSDNIVDPSSFFTWDLENGLEIFAVRDKDNIFIGRAIASGNSKVFKKLDEERPARRFTHGTSFRLARIMVNLLGLEKEKTIVDPFCGTGTFLIEALIQGYNAIGIDNDPDLVNDSKKNLHWLRKDMGIHRTSQVILGDAQKVEFIADGCIFEPYMGPFLKSLPRNGEAMHIRKELDELYDKIFQNLNKNLTAKAPVVCILPDIPVYNEKALEMDEDILFRNGFGYVALPNALKIRPKIKYNTPDGSKIIRHIYVLEKTD